MLHSVEMLDKGMIPVPSGVSRRAGDFIPLLSTVHFRTEDEEEPGNKIEETTSNKARRNHSRAVP